LTSVLSFGLWVADITYVLTWAGFLWLAIVLDALEPPRDRLGHDDAFKSGFLSADGSPLFYDLIRPQQDRRRDRQAERLRGLQIDDQLEFLRLLVGTLQLSHHPLRVGRSLDDGSRASNQ
jgi:hypothetical protein